VLRVVQSHSTYVCCRRLQRRFENSESDVGERFLWSVTKLLEGQNDMVWIRMPAGDIVKVGFTVRASSNNTRGTIGDRASTKLWSRTADDD
jgi:hypothetical protein